MERCLVTVAENRAEAKIESKDRRLAKAADALSAEYMAAACVPLIATVPVPTDRQPGRRASFISVFEDDLSAPGRMARVVSILLRCEEGRDLVEEMADAHGDYFAEFVQ